MEFAGAIPALEFAFQATQRGGTTVTAALPHPNARLQLSTVMLVGQEKSKRILSGKLRSNSGYSSLH